MVSLSSLQVSLPLPPVSVWPPDALFCGKPFSRRHYSVSSHLSEVFFSVNFSISVTLLFMFVLVSSFQAKSLAVPGAAPSGRVPRLPLGARDRSHSEHSCVFLPFVLSSWCVAPLGRGPFCFAVPVKASRPAAQAAVHASRAWAATPGSSSEGDVMVFVLGLGTVS